jgi:HD-GYP domain-containing protein (c-di-GMP phosphodiesterase class II)
MVRFSDIIRLDEIKESTGKLLKEEIEEAGLRLSDSEVFEAQEEESSNPDTPSVEDEGEAEIAALHETFLERAVYVQERVRNDQGISPSPILSDLHNLLKEDRIDKLYEYGMSAPEDREEMLLHTVRVTATSLKIGKGLGYDTEMLLKLGLAAFLENVGLHKIPDDVLTGTGKGQREKMDAIREHPIISSEILLSMGNGYRWLAEVALQVHERVDGSGYPKGLQGGEISELASIIGLVDTYITMTKRNMYKEDLTPTNAIRSIIKEKKGLFPARILKAFLDQISLFPVRTYVRLNNKSIGRVISTDKDRPLRPRIEILYDGQGNRVDLPEVISLTENPLLYVMESIDEKKLTEMN